MTPEFQQLLLSINELTPEVKEMFKGINEISPQAKSMMDDMAALLSKFSESMDDVPELEEIETQDEVVGPPVILEEDLKESGDILGESVKLSRDIFEELYKYGKRKGIPIGCNIESVAIRKAEIEASVELLEEVRNIIKENS